MSQRSDGRLVGRLLARFDRGQRYGLAGHQPPARGRPSSHPSDIYDLGEIIEQAGRVEGLAEFKRRAERAARIVGCPGVSTEGES